ncbi:hypothetical protein niasHT_008515 [Heterodera trifolii]|uniref:MATH domain-containing protein n=1 Tax=Heterodera trifolii TaxID=157864 RepID=A0ABD2M421_9BILA
MHFNLFPLIYIFIILHFKQVCPAPDSISGQFELRIEKFSQFANGPIRQIKYGQPKYIRGLHWRLNAFVNEEQNGKKSLHCFVAVINSGFVNRIDIIREWNLIEEIDKLLEHCQSSKSDVVLLSVNLKMDPPTGRSFPFNDVLLVKNDEYDLAVPIKINKKVHF